MTDVVAPGVSRAVPYLLAGCTAISVLSTDLFAPSLPHLPDALGTDANTAQLTVSINLAAYSIAQLLHGPLADRYGRRGLLLVGFSLFAIASCLCALAMNIDELITGRFIQGMFSSVPSVVVVLMIRELYGGARAVTAMALYGMAVGLAPAVGPLIGGYLQVWYGWRAGFWLVAALAVAMTVAIALYVPETPFRPRQLRVGSIAASYAQLLMRRSYIQLLLPLALIFGALFAFVTTGPLVFIDLLGVPTERYGLCYLVIVVAYIGGSLIANRWSSRFAPLRMLQGAASVALFAGITILVPQLFGVSSIVLMLASMAVYGASLGVVLAAGPILLLDSVDDLAQGPAAALLGAAQLGAAALAGLISGGLYDGSALSMVATICGFLILGTVPVLLMRRQHNSH